MSIATRTLVLSLFTLLAASGCRTSDPLAGTWDNDECFGTDSTPDDVESCGTTLIFTDALTIALAAQWISEPATAENPGCITTERVTGQTWSTSSEPDHEVLLIEGTGAATTERADCVDPDDDMVATASSDISIPSGDVDYRIDGDVLTVLTSSLTGTYAR